MIHSLAVETDHTMTTYFVGVAAFPMWQVITDCIEVMHEGYHADAIITLGGCDKRCP